MKKILVISLNMWRSKQLWLVALLMMLTSVPVSAQVQRVVAEAQGIT